MEGEDVDVAAAQAPDDVVDLARAGQEDEDVTVLLGQGPAGDAGDVREELRAGAPRRQPWRGARRGAPLRPDRVERTGDRDDGGALAEERRDPVRLDRGRHRDEREVLAQRRAGLDEHGEEEVGVDLALVHLVEDDGAHARQLRVALETAQERAGGDELDEGLLAHLPLAAHGEAGHAADRLPEKAGEAACRGPRGDAPGLGDDDPAAQGDGERGRHERGLPAARRGLQDGGAPGPHRPHELLQALGDGQWRRCGEERGEIGEGHATSVPPAVPTGRPRDTLAG